MIEQGVVSASNYKLLCYRKNIQVVRRGCRGQEALVAYESLPDRFKEAVDRLNGESVYAVLKEDLLGEQITDSPEAADYYDAYVLEDGRHLPTDKRREYYANAIVLDAMGKEIARRNGKRKASGQRAGKYWDEMAEAAKGLDPNRWPINLPTNARSLQRKYGEYARGGYEALIHQNYTTANVNSAKIANEEQVSAIAVLMSDPRNLDDAQVARLYNIVAKAEKWKTITDSTVAIWRKKLESTIYARRHGAKAWANNKAMQLKRKAPEYPLYYWTMDGWDVELAYQDKQAGKGTSYTNRVTMVVIIDACCKYPIGYAIGVHESPALIREALRNAHHHTEQLFGTMYKVQQIQSDHYQMKTLAPLYWMSSARVTPAAVGNAKGKIIEPWFRYFNKKYCQLQPNWTGFGVTSRKELQPNGDYLQKHKGNFPDLQGVIHQVVSMLEAERRELHDRYVAQYAAMPAENRLKMDYGQYLLAYGETSEETNVLQGSGLKMQINGIKHTYDCWDPTFRDHASERWHIVYDPDHMEKAMAVNTDQTLEYAIEEKYVQPMALMERKDGDREEMQRVMDYNLRLRKKIADKMNGYQETASRIDGAKQLEMAQKFLITDSHGQHKDRRNAARDMVAQIQPPAGGPTEQPEQPKKAPPTGTDDDLFEMLDDY